MDNHMDTINVLLGKALKRASGIVAGGNTGVLQKRLKEILENHPYSKIIDAEPEYKQALIETLQGIIDEYGQNPRKSNKSRTQVNTGITKSPISIHDYTEGSGRDTIFHVGGREGRQYGINDLIASKTRSNINTLHNIPPTNEIPILYSGDYTEHYMSGRNLLTTQSIKTLRENSLFISSIIGLCGGVEGFLSDVLQIDINKHYKVKAIRLNAVNEYNNPMRITRDAQNIQICPAHIDDVAMCLEDL